MLGYILKLVVCYSFGVRQYAQACGRGDSEASFTLVEVISARSNRLGDSVRLAWTLPKPTR